MTGFLLAAIWIYLSSFHFPAPGEILQFVWVVGGVVTAGVLVFITYVGLMFPLKRQTLQRYPRCGRLPLDLTANLDPIANG